MGRIPGCVAFSSMSPPFRADARLAFERLWVLATTGDIKPGWLDKEMYGASSSGGRLFHPPSIGTSCSGQLLQRFVATESSLALTFVLSLCGEDGDASECRYVATAMKKVTIHVLLHFLPFKFPYILSFSLPLSSCEKKPWQTKR